MTFKGEMFFCNECGVYFMSENNTWRELTPEEEQNIIKNDKRISELHECNDHENK